MNTKKTTIWQRLSRCSDSAGYVFSDGCIELERQITLGARIGWQDRMWVLWRKDGEAIEAAKTIEELIFKLYT